MNYNYPFLAGYLEGVLKTLATDYDFLALKDSESRQNYVRARIKEAYESMLKNPNQKIGLAFYKNSATVIK